MSDTLVVNLYGGPGTGKSTTAAGVFYRLKQAGYNAEYVQEYAKDRMWQQDRVALDFQPYVMGKQAFRLYRLLGKVDVIVTDSPILLSAIYAGWGADMPEFEAYLVALYRQFTSLDIFLARHPAAHPYNPAGRWQSEAEAQEVDSQVLNMLKRLRIPCVPVTINTGDETVNQIVRLTTERLEKIRAQQGVARARGTARTT